MPNRNGDVQFDAKGGIRLSVGNVDDMLKQAVKSKKGKEYILAQVFGDTSYKGRQIRVRLMVTTPVAARGVTAPTDLTKVDLTEGEEEGAEDQG